MIYLYQGGRVVIITSDEKTNLQLQQLMLDGSKTMLRMLTQRLITIKDRQREEQPKASTSSKTNYYYAKHSNSRGRYNKSSNTKSTRGRGGAKKRSTPSTSMTSSQAEVKMLKETVKKNNSPPKSLLAKQQQQDMSSAFEECFKIILHPPNQAPAMSDVPVHPWSKLEIFITTYSAQNTILGDLEPSFIIMYDQPIACIRKVEVYKAARPGFAVRVYFLLYENSVEHQQYITALQREKEAFDSLIMSKSKIVIPSVDTILSTLEQISPKKSSPQNTRRAGGREEAPAKRRIIVDSREFNSSLPSFLHLTGYEVVPVTISVGDYILTPDVCIERKSPSDLWQSLNAGRLYSQAEKMSKYYKHVGLLIQFPDDGPFHLVAPEQYKSEIDGTLITSKLALLTIHFPQLRLFWSPSLQWTCQFFDEIKHNEKEPDPESAAIIGTGEGEDEETEGTNQAIELLKRLPGVHDGNIFHIMSNVNSVSDLCSKNLLQLEELMGMNEGNRLYEFLQLEPDDERINAPLA